MPGVRPSTPQRLPARSCGNAGDTDPRCSGWTLVAPTAASSALSITWPNVAGGSSESWSRKPGGRWVGCGYDTCCAALQFHHLDPRAKAFALSHEGATRGIERARAEAMKCVLLCANCHAEVEAGVRVLQAPRGGFEPPRTD